jgi:subtilisin family serine protease
VHNYDTTDGTDDDLHGHGTHTSGTVGSATYGVAKNVALYGMKVCNQAGSCELSAVNQAILDTITDSATRSCPNGVVINMSLGAAGDEWISIKQAVAAATSAGIFVAVAAGNSAQDATGFMPAAAPGACAVGASDVLDVMASFSNFGKPVVVFGPGVDVKSTYKDGATVKMSGTSMASPHIAGLGAYLQGLKGKMDPVALCKLIGSTATPDKISGVPSGTVNSVAFNGIS